MLHEFIDWINSKKDVLKEMGIVTEETNVISIDVTDNPSVTVHHYKPEERIGLITIWDNNQGHAEVLDYQSGDTLLTEHFEIDVHFNFDHGFKRYFNVMSSEEIT